MRNAPLRPAALLVLLVSGFDAAAGATEIGHLELSELAAPAGGVADARYLPDGSRVLYLADSEIADVDELWSVAPDGTDLVRLSHDLALDETVWEWEIDPTGARAVYWAGDDLYSVPTGGGAAVRLTPDLPEGGALDSFEIALDGSRVVYRSDHGTQGLAELWSVEIAGGTPIRLSLPSPAGRVHAFWVGDGRAVFAGDQDSLGVRELWSTPLGGGTPTKLHPDLSGLLDASTDVHVSPDGTRVAFRGDLHTNATLELYGVAIEGGDWARLNGTLPFGGQVDRLVGFSSDGSHVVYRADQVVQGQSELFAVPASGSRSARGSGGDTTGRINHALTPDQDVGVILLGPGERVLYRVDDTVYTVPVTGGAVAELVTLDGHPSGFSEDGGHVLYRHDTLGDGRLDLYAIPAEGGTPVRLNQELPAGGFVGESTGTPDGATVLYLAQTVFEGPAELWSVPIVGGTPIRVHAPLGPSQHVEFLKGTSPSGTEVLYVGQIAQPGVDELHRAAVAGGGEIRVSGEMSAVGGWVREARWSPSERRVVYLADESVRFREGLHAVDPDGGNRVTLFEPSLSTQEVRDLQVSESHVVYVLSTVALNDRIAEGGPAARGELPSIRELYSVVSTGGSPPVRLDDPGSTGGAVEEHRIAGERVLFLATYDGSPSEARSVPIDGGPSVRLSRAAEAGDVVVELLLSPDGTRAAWRTSTGRIAVAPIDGSAEPTLLEAGPADYGIRFSALGDHLLYLAPPAGRGGGGGGDSSRLFAVPVGGGPRVDLSGPVVEAILDFSSTPDGAHVVYRGLVDQNDVFELYRVPVSGGSPTKLNPDFGPGTQGVREHFVTDDPATVVYHADQRFDGQNELFAADGTDSWLISHADAASGVVDVTVVGDRALYLAPIVGGGYELWSTPIAGGLPVRLHAELAPGGSVDHYVVSGNGAWVYFAADLVTPGADELYRVPIAGGTPELWSEPPVDGGELDDIEASSQSGSEVLYTGAFLLRGRDDLLLARDLDAIFADGFETGSLLRWSH